MSAHEPVEASANATDPANPPASDSPTPPRFTRAQPRFSPSAVGWLTVVWVLLWGDLTLANVLVGLIVGALVTLILPLPKVPFAGNVSLLGSLRLLGALARDILLASVHVTQLALRFRSQPHGGVLRVPLRSRNDLYLTLTADLCSLVPGSLIVEAHRNTSTLYVHVLDLSGPNGVEDARASVYAQEARVMYALASAEEIAAAGLPPRRLGGASAPLPSHIPPSAEVSR